jgi:hypothetical protein
VGQVGEALALRVIVLHHGAAPTVVIRCRKLGRGTLQSVTARHLSRGVYEGTLPPLSAAGLEYQVEVQMNGRTLRWPATAPAIGQTVVAMPRT